MEIKNISNLARNITIITLRTQHNIHYAIFIICIHIIIQFLHAKMITKENIYMFSDEVSGTLGHYVYPGFP